MRSLDISSRRHRGRHSLYGSFTCGYAMVLPDITMTLTVTDRTSGVVLARTADMERSEVRDELHRLRELFPLDEGYDITATSKERAS